MVVHNMKYMLSRSIPLNLQKYSVARINFHFFLWKIKHFYCSFAPFVRYGFILFLSNSILGVEQFCKIITSIRRQFSEGEYIGFYQGVTKRCRLSLLTNSALVIRVQLRGREAVAGSQPMSKAVHIM
jgi:hypothetical protein